MIFCTGTRLKIALQLLSTNLHIETLRFHVLKNVDSIKFTKFGAKDVVRHSLVQEIVEAYDNFE